MLAFASVTGPLVKLATSVIGSLGLGGVAALCACTGVIGIPGTEPTMLFAGFNVYEGHLSLLGIITFGVVGDMVGASIAYGIGYWGRREVVQRQGAKLHMNTRRLDRAERWSERRGLIVIFVSRLLPFIRAAFPYAAGIARVPFGRFFALATAGSIVWIGALGLIGREVGRNWQSWRHHLEYADYVGAALLIMAVVYLIVRWNRSRAVRSAPYGDGREMRQGDGEHAAVDVVGK